MLKSLNISMSYLSEFSPVVVFLSGDAVLRTVVIILLLASILSWSLIVSGAVSVFTDARRSHRFDVALVDYVGAVEGTLHNWTRANARPSSAQAVYLAGLTEWIESTGRVSTVDRSAVLERVGMVIENTISMESKKLISRLSLLATIGSISPFIGLFGTVWGVMNAFSTMDMSKTVNLSAVAPGISEALLLTALGLVTAIPAVVGYNRLLVAVQAQERSLVSAAVGLLVRYSRQLDSMDGV
jgi:biopolymer transport protein TolQ